MWYWKTGPGRGGVKKGEFLEGVAIEGAARFPEGRGVEVVVQEGRGQGGCGGTPRGLWSGRGLRAQRKSVGVVPAGAAGSRGAWPRAAPRAHGAWGGTKGRLRVGAGLLRGLCGEVSPDS